MDRIKKKTIKTYRRKSTVDDINLHRSSLEGEIDVEHGTTRTSNMISSTIGCPSPKEQEDHDLDGSIPRDNKGSSNSKKKDNSSATLTSSCGSTFDLSREDMEAKTITIGASQSGLENQEPRSSLDLRGSEVRTTDVQPAISGFSNPGEIAAREDTPRDDVAEEMVDIIPICSSEDRTRIESPMEGTIDPKLTLLACDEGDELAQPLPTLPSEGIPKGKSQSRIKRKRQESDQTNETGSEEELAGLPEEHYHPRPSRFRATGAADGLVSGVDFSKRPESAVKAKNKIKRRKTTGGAVIIHVDENEPSNANTPDSKIELAETRNDVTMGSLPPEIDGKQEASYEEPELCSIKADPPKRKRGRPKKSALEESSLKMEVNSHESASLADGDSAVHDSVEKPLVSKNLERVSKEKKRHKRQVADDDEREDHDYESSNEFSASDVDSDVHRPIRKKASKNPTRPLQPSSKSNLPTPPTSISIEIPVTKDQPPITHALARDTPSLPTPAPTLPPETPQKQIKKSDKGPDKHSPLNSGRVSYRVGLSRRARIEPLLKIVRK